MKFAPILVLSLASYCFASDSAFDSQSECEQVCVGDRDIGCSEKSVEGESKFVCTCQAQYFADDTCKRECGALYWSWFTYGTCTDSVNDGFCAQTCAWRIRLWATVFIIILFASAVAILVCILPMCISSCKACLMIKKEEKKKKRAEKYGGQENYAASYVEGGTVPRNQIAPIAKPPIQYYYNPYAYNPYATQGRESYYGRLQ